MKAHTATIASLSLLAAACSGGFEPYNPMETALDPDAWPAFRFDAARTGASATAVTGREVSEAWRFEAINTTDYGAAKGSPSVDEESVFVGSDDARFQAFDSETGDLVWNRKIDGTSQGFHGTPSLGRDHVYVGAYDGTLYAFDRNSGDEVWRYEMGFQVGASPIFVPEHGRVYNTHERSDTGGGHIVAVDARDGSEIWNYAIRAHPHSSVAVSVAEDMLFVGDNLAIVHAIDTRNGDKVWDYVIPDNGDEESDVKTTPSVLEDRGLVVVGAWSTKVHAFETRSGDIRWEYEAGARIMGSTAYAAGSGLVFVGSLSPTNSVHAIDADTGEEAWRFEVGAGVMSSPAVNADESLVVVGANDGYLYALDAESGELVWRHEIGGPVTGSPALHRDMVYITAKRGDLVALRTR